METQIPEKLRSAGALAGFGGAVTAAALLGRAATHRGERAGRRELPRARLQPPDWVFGPVWTGLYTLMAGAAWRLWKAPPGPERSKALALWGTQLAFNAAWSPLFFGLRRPRWALVDLTLLQSTLAQCVNAARRVDPTAARMLLPYVAWVGFAGLLNRSIVRLSEGTRRSGWRRLLRR